MLEEPINFSQSHRGFTFGAALPASVLSGFGLRSVQALLWGVVVYAVLTQLAGLGFRVSMLLEGDTSATVFRGNDLNLYLRVGSSAVVALVYCTFGLALARYKSNQVFAALIALTLLTTSITTSSLSPALALPWVSFVHPVFSALNTALLLYIVLLFPSGSFASRHTLVLGHTWLLFCLLSLLFPAWPCNVVYLESWLKTPVLSLLVCFSPFVIAFRALAARTRRDLYPQQKRQSNWFLAGTLSLFVGMLLNFILMALYPLEVQGYGTSLFFQVVHPLLHNTVLLILPLCLGVAHYRYHLFGPEVVVEHTLTYLILAAVSVGVYVTLLTLTLTLPSGYSSSLVMVLSTATLAVLLHPLRSSLQRAIGQALHGQRNNPYEVLSQLAHSLELSKSPQDALETISHALDHHLKVVAGGVEVYLQDTIREVHRWGMGGVRLDFPHHQRFLLITEGEPLGMLWVTLKRESFSEEESRLMRDVARHTAHVVQNLRLNLELQRSREQRVDAHERELKRIRNDLHDGVAPVLVGLTRRLDTALGLPEGLEQRRRIEQVQRALLDTVGDLRRVIYGLRPPALDELGLLGALRQQGDRFSLPIIFRLPESISLSAALEVAVYHIVLEALNNVHQHAHARQVWVSVQLSQMLELTIEDDGTGLLDAITPGVGLRSMRERSEELGGRFSVQPRHATPVLVAGRGTASSGLRIQVSLPLSPT